MAMQTDQYGRVVDISTQDLITGFAAKSKENTVQVLSHALDFSRERDEKIKKASSGIKVSGEAEEFVKKVSEGSQKYRDRKGNPDKRETVNFKDWESANYKSLMRAHKETNEWTGNRAKTWTNFYTKAFTETPFTRLTIRSSKFSKS